MDLLPPLLYRYQNSLEPKAQIKFCKTIADNPEKTIKIKYGNAIETFSSMVTDCDPITGSPQHYVFRKWDDKIGQTTIIYNPNKKDGKDALVTFVKSPEQYSKDLPPTETRQDVTVSKTSVVASDGVNSLTTEEWELTPNEPEVVEPVVPEQPPEDNTNSGSEKPNN